MNLIDQKILFNKKECNFILNNSTEYKRSLVHINNENVQSDLRTSYESTIDLSDNLSEPLRNLILEKLKNNFNIIDLPNFAKILKYEVGQYFKPHSDNRDFPERIKTLIIQLSDESEYEGGELVITDRSITMGNPKIVANKTIGNVILFNSELTHSAREILSGTRYAFVLWLKQENLNI